MINFLNEVTSSDVDTYRALIHADGPYKQAFKSVKAAFEGRGLERIFVTGVSPVALNDLTSGFNIAKDVSLEPELAALCGFREPEIRDLLELVGKERGVSSEAVDEAVDVMRTWYNGYRFSRQTEELVYNPTNVLYFLEHFYRRGSPPGELYDRNLNTDRGKLAFLARTAAGEGLIEQLTESGDGTITVSRLVAKALAEGRAQVGRYRAALLKREGESKLNLRSYVAVAVGLERLLGEELP